MINITPNYLIETTCHDFKRSANYKFLAEKQAINLNQLDSSRQTCKSRWLLLSGVWSSSIKPIFHEDFSGWAMSRIVKNVPEITRDDSPHFYFPIVKFFHSKLPRQLFKGTSNVAFRESAFAWIQWCFQKCHSSENFRVRVTMWNMKKTAYLTKTFTTLTLSITNENEN